MVDDIRRPQREAEEPMPEKPRVFYPERNPTFRDEPVETVEVEDEKPAQPAEADSEQNKLDSTDDSKPTPAQKEQGSAKKWQFWKHWKHWNTQKRALFLATVGLIVIVISGGIWLILTSTHKSAPVAHIPKAIAKEPDPIIYYSNLSGLKISDQSLNKRPVTGVMIENSLDARPQSGLSQAGVVYEAIAEGGITRFLALYQDETPTNIGPVRSARPYFVQWARGYDANYAHVGGSPEALKDIKNWGVKDLDQFYNASAYRRITSRYAPHNVYTNLDNLLKLGNKKGFTSSTFTGFPRKDDTSAASITAGTINFDISSSNYNVKYIYDTATNSYKRSEGGTAHIDANTNKQLSPKNVVALITNYGLESDGVHSKYTVIGSGQAYVFMDGVVVQGTWQKDSLEGPLTLKDQSGQPIKLNRGQTWITALSGSNRVRYAP